MTTHNFATKPFLRYQTTPLSLSLCVYLCVAMHTRSDCTPDTESLRHVSGNICELFWPRVWQWWMSRLSPAKNWCTSTCATSDPGRAGGIGHSPPTVHQLMTNFYLPVNVHTHRWAFHPQVDCESALEQMGNGLQINGNIQNDLRNLNKPEGLLSHFITWIWSRIGEKGQINSTLLSAWSSSGLWLEIKLFMSKFNAF